MTENYNAHEDNSKAWNFDQESKPVTLRKRTDAEMIIALQLQFAHHEEVIKLLQTEIGTLKKENWNLSQAKANNERLAQVNNRITHVVSEFEEVSNRQQAEIRELQHQVEKLEGSVVPNPMVVKTNEPSFPLIPAPGGSKGDIHYARDY